MPYLRAYISGAMYTGVPVRLFRSSPDNTAWLQPAHEHRTLQKTVQSQLKSCSHVLHVQLLARHREPGMVWKSTTHAQAALAATLCRTLQATHAPDLHRPRCVLRSRPVNLELARESEPPLAPVSQVSKIYTKQIPF